MAESRGRERSTPAARGITLDGVPVDDVTVDGGAGGSTLSGGGDLGAVEVAISSGWLTKRKSSCMVLGVAASHRRVSG